MDNDPTDDDDDVRAGRSPGEITDAHKYEFLQHIRGGMNRAEAAEMIGFYGRHFRAVCSPASMFYDEDFAGDYAREIGSLEHAEGRLERLRAEAQRRALGGSDRLLEKLLMVHDPDWAKLRETKSEVEVNVRHFIETHFEKLSAAQIEELLATLDSGQIEAPVDAEYHELGPGETL